MPIAPQLPAILRRRIPVVAARRDHRRHPPTGQSISQGLAVIPAIGHQPRRSLAGASWHAGTPDGPRVQGRVQEGAFCWSCRVQGLLPPEDPRHRPQPSPSCLCRVWACRRWAPLFRWSQAALGTAFVPASLVRIVELGQERPPSLQESPALCPLVEPAPTGTGAAVSAGECTPWYPAPQAPEEALNTAPMVAPGPPTTGSRLRAR
jgi:hypothetical protein